MKESGHLITFIYEVISTIIITFNSILALKVDLMTN